MCSTTEHPVYHNTPISGQFDDQFQSIFNMEIKYKYICLMTFFQKSTKIRIFKSQSTYNWIVDWIKQINEDVKGAVLDNV